MFDIDAACGAQRSQGQTLTLSPDVVSGRQSLVCLSANSQKMVETDGIEPTT
jgi:hypothetical protein